MQSNNKRIERKRRGHRMNRTALSATIAAMLGLYGTGALVPAHAQATTGTIFGTAPVATGESVQITGGAGFNRTIPVDASGHYAILVPIGTYDVSLLQNGQSIQTHRNVTPNAAGAIEVDFTSTAAANGGAASGVNAQNLAAVTVTANALPAIDVTSTNQNLTVTSQQLRQLPLARNAGAIALLAPGTVPGAAMLGGGPLSGPPGSDPVISFGGSTIVENAYYINGFNTSDPLSNTGGIALPYGAIDQQQTLTSGYGAQYGRSAGGVISQIGKSGTNEWHFGGQALWTPAFARSRNANAYFENPRVTQPGQEKGDIERYRAGDSLWNMVYDGYLGGPLIKDKLYMFIAAESDKTQTTTVGSVSAGNVAYQRYSNPKYYAKLDWNINDNNSLALTYIYNAMQQDAPENYYYDYDTHQSQGFQSLGQYTKNAFKIGIAKYTSYITDNLTLNVLYGKMRGSYFVDQPGYPGFDPTLPFISNTTLENPLYTGGKAGGITNSNTTVLIADPKHKSSVSNLRLDLDWKLGDHDLQFGIDNDTAYDFDDGTEPTGPGYIWIYEKGDPNIPVYQGTYNVAAPSTQPGGQQGYYVFTQNTTSAASVKVVQRAQYIQDNWQVTPRLLLNIGLRNDQFTNYNSAGQPYLRLTSPQWAPRLGFSWDVNGDSSLKVFGNVGRYYLAMPTSVALREASGSYYLRQYYTYTGIDSNGIPQGLHPLATDAPGGQVPINNENGTPPDPKTVAARSLKAEYQDQFVLGMQQQIGPSWVYGVTGIVNKLGRAIDDWGDMQTLYDQLIAQGANPATLTVDDLAGSYLVNPGETNVMRVRNEAGGYDTATLTRKDMGFPSMKRKYYSLDLYLEHPFDGKWFGKIDYTFSRSYGNTEGPVQSNIGQGGSSQSITEQWDFGQIMEYASGVQANDQKHQLRAYGAYQITPEWMIGGVLRIASGTPESCLGYYGPGDVNFNGYGNSFHWCGGVPTPPGSTGFTPWTHQLDLQAEYRPLWAGKKLGFQIQIHNVFNEQNVTQITSSYGTAAAPQPTYLLAQGFELPRYVNLGVTYDF